MEVYGCIWMYVFTYLCMYISGDVLDHSYVCTSLYTYSTKSMYVHLYRVTQQASYVCMPLYTYSSHMYVYLYTLTIPLYTYSTSHMSRGKSRNHLYLYIDI